MPAEAPFLFSIAGLSASFAGLAGLVAGLRRGTDLRPSDQFRLRQIVEFAFINIGVAIGYFPLVVLVGDEALARRALAVVAIVLLVGHFALLRTRALTFGTTWNPADRSVALGAMALAVGSGVALLVWPVVGVEELLLLVLLARPMLAFARVLSSMETPGPPRG